MNKQIDPLEPGQLFLLITYDGNQLFRKEAGGKFSQYFSSFGMLLPFGVESLPAGQFIGPITLPEKSLGAPLPQSPRDPFRATDFERRVNTDGDV